MRGAGLFNTSNILSHILKGCEKIERNLNIGADQFQSIRYWGKYSFKFAAARG